jgi:hypothetical protein
MTEAKRTREQRESEAIAAWKQIVASQLATRR